MQTINQFFLYFFQSPPSAFQYAMALWVYVVLLIGAAVGIVVMIKKNKEDKAFKKVFRNFPTKLVTIGVLLAFYLLSREYSIPLLSMRIMLAVILAVSVYVDYTLVMAYLKKYPEEKKFRHDREQINKYIPHKHKKHKR